MAKQKSEPLEMDAPAAPAVVEAVNEAHHLRLLANYSFYDDDGSYKAWTEQAVVTDPDEIKVLVKRKAPVERIVK